MILSIKNLKYQSHLSYHLQTFYVFSIILSIKNLKYQSHLSYHLQTFYVFSLIFHCISLI